MESFLDIFHRIIIISIAVICLFNGVILYLRSRNKKASRTLAYVILLWGFVYLYRVVAFYIDIFPESYSIFRANVLIVGIAYTFMMVLFPMQVLIPGWLNWKRLLVLFLPIFLISTGYVAGMYILDEEPEELMDYSQLWASIGHFNVWYRFVILICNFVYIMGIVMWLFRFERKYVTWKNNNFSDRDDVDIAWLHSYDVIMGLIFVCYIAVEMIGGKVPVIIHSFVVIVSFSYLFYKGLFYESPYPENYFSEEKTGKIIAEEELVSIVPEEKLVENNEQTFQRRIPEYLDQLQLWMDTERPYLYKDFKLTDVARVLPLNRSYLSRIFNDGYGKSFSEVVRCYRVEYSKEVIHNNPEMPMYKVADLSGFNSDSTFVKAFKQVTGMTPFQFKQEK